MRNIIYYFVVNNSDDDVYTLVEEFRICAEKREAKVIIEIYDFDLADKRDREWSSSLLYHMGVMRNMCLDKAKQLECDFVFSVDSDIVVPRYLLKQLISRELPVISPVFFAKWSANNYLSNRAQLLGLIFDCQEEHNKYRNDSKFYEVGLLGAIALINMKYITDQINYSGWRNNQFWGEDRTFCTRLSIGNVKLYGDSSFDITHIDNIDDLQTNLQYFVNDNFVLHTLDWDFKRRTPFGTNSKSLIIFKMIRYKISNLTTYLKVIIKSLFSIPRIS